MESLPGNFFAFLLPLKGLAEIAERRKTDLGKSLSLGGGGGGATPPEEEEEFEKGDEGEEDRGKETKEEKRMKEEEQEEEEEADLFRRRRRRRKRRLESTSFQEVRDSPNARGEIHSHILLLNSIEKWILIRLGGKGVRGKTNLARRVLWLQVPSPSFNLPLQFSVLRCGGKNSARGTAAP